jgi:hypothetical protein
MHTLYNIVPYLSSVAGMNISVKFSGNLVVGLITG